MGDLGIRLSCSREAARRKNCELKKREDTSDRSTSYISKYI